MVKGIILGPTRCINQVRKPGKRLEPAIDAVGNCDLSALCISKIELVLIVEVVIKPHYEVPLLFVLRRVEYVPSGV